MRIFQLVDTDGVAAASLWSILGFFVAVSSSASFSEASLLATPAVGQLSEDEEEAGMVEEEEVCAAGRSVGLFSNAGRNLTKTAVILSQPVPSPTVSGAKQWSNNCKTK